jgi:chromosome segregation ATPase
MAKQRKDVRARLVEVQERAASAGMEQRQARAEAASIAKVSEELRERQVDAYARGDEERGDALAREIEQTSRRLESANARAEGLARRLSGAQAEVAQFRREQGREILDARSSDLEEVASALTRAGHEFVRAHRRFVSERQAVDDDVRHVEGALPAQDGPPAVHEWEQEANAIERVITQHREVSPPKPRWAGLRYARQRDAVHQRLKDQRRKLNEGLVDAVQPPIGG